MISPNRDTGQTPAVGNDIVDLEDRSTAGRHGDERFVTRILDAQERSALAAAAEPSLDLWAFWAAKEAAYKVASKLEGTPPVFVHAAFSVSWTAVESAGWEGFVAYHGLRVPVHVVRTGAAIQAVAVFGAERGSVLSGAERLGADPEEWDRHLADSLPRFTPREVDAVHSFPSAAVRLLARSHVAATLGSDEDEVEIVCDPGVTGRRPPRVLLRGRPAPCDVSLSHHGRWVAWALLPQNPTGR